MMTESVITMTSPIGSLRLGSLRGRWRHSS
jgi:hypothetical protein